MSKRTPSPTTRQYSAFQHAYAVFNSELFGDALPDCLITLQRKANCHGYFSFKRFTSPDGKATTDEIAINAQFLASHGVMGKTATALIHRLTAKRAIKLTSTKQRSSRHKHNQGGSALRNRPELVQNIEPLRVTSVIIPESIII